MGSDIDATAAIASKSKHTSDLHLRRDAARDLERERWGWRRLRKGGEVVSAGAETCASLGERIGAAAEDRLEGDAPRDPDPPEASRPTPPRQANQKEERTDRSNSAGRTNTAVALYDVVTSIVRW